MDLGLVTDAERDRLLSSCVAVAQPSTNESFSRVMMEAWLHGKPVAVHAQCLATAMAIRNAQGGWLSSTEDEWAALFVDIERAETANLLRMGENGKRYAQLAADWEGVIDRYEDALTGIVRSRAEAKQLASAAGSEINQFLPNLTYGDAISNHALIIRDHLRQLGYGSRIFARFIDPRVAHECELFSADAVRNSPALIYHHSIGTEITPHIIKYRGPKCLIYHNITPAEFFEPYRPAFAAILRKGRKDLPKLAAQFPLSYGDSAYNAKELAASGFASPRVLPILVDPSHWAFAPDADLMNRLQDGCTNLLFVGRVAPNKKQDDLIRAYAKYKHLDPASRLTLAGGMEADDPYVAHLHETIRMCGLADSVTLTGGISQAQLAAYYRTADLFWSMSEHEGFCVPLVEAMWFDIPILAFKGSAVPETLAEAAVIFSDKRNLPELAALAHLLVTDIDLREKVLRAQRTRRLEFLPEKILPIITKIGEELRSVSNETILAAASRQRWI
jgi:glycosyltransferase involved in cell wall biosynthesis